MQKPFLFIVLVFLTFGASAQIYKGTIGNYPVYFQVEYIDEDGSLSGMYFYESKGLDIPFEGTLREKQLIVKAGPFLTADEDFEQFTLLKVGTAMRGTWKLHDKELSVSLKEIDPAKVKPLSNPFLPEKRFTPYETIRAGLAAFIPTDSVTRLDNGIEITWYKEKHWDSQLFRVTKGLPEPTMKWANERLEALQIELFSNYGSCGGGLEHFVPDFFINADFLSLEITQSWYCGGAHPDFSSEQINLDLEHLVDLSTDDLIHFPGVLKETEDNFTEWSAYRDDFAIRINDYIKALYPEQMPSPDTDPVEDDACNYDDPSIWECSEVRITPDGFKIGAYFVRSMRSCDDPEWAYIPYDVIEEFINPAYRKQLMALSK